MHPDLAAHSFSPRDTMRLLMCGGMVSQLLFVAAKLNIPDLLKDGPKSDAEIATATNTQAPAVYRVLRGLALLGVLAEDEPHQFRLLPLGETLRSDLPGSLHARALLWSTLFYDAWGELQENVTTGVSGFQVVHGKNLYAFLGDNPDIRATFSKTMAAEASAIFNALDPIVDFSTVKTVVDVGGGSGHLLARLLVKYPNLRGVLFDKAPGTKLIEEAGVADRCTVVTGDFFKGVPGDADCYMITRSVQDWSDEDAVRLFRSCHAAARPGSSFVLVEPTISPRVDKNILELGMDAFYDILMMVQTGGRCRTENEFRALLEEASYQYERATTTPFGLTVIESRRP